MTGSGFAAELLKKLDVSAEDAKKASDMLTDDEISKAATHSTTLTAGQNVPSLWQQGHLHRVPGPDEIKVGPVQEASGGGAEKMVGDYSNPAGQRGIQMEAERLASHFHNIYGAMKSQADAINNVIDVVNKTNSQVSNLTTVAAAMLAKAEDDEKKKDKDEDGMAHGDKACALFAKAKKLLKKSKLIQREAKACANEAQAKELKRCAKLMRKAASRCLYNAQVEALAGRGTHTDYTFETRKGINAIIDANPAVKADMKMFHEDDDDKDDEKKAKKAYKKAKQPVVASEAPQVDDAAKAVQGHSDAKGNQSDKKDPATGNQDDSAVKAEIAQAKDEMANVLKGVGLLEGKINTLFDAIAAKPVTGPVGEIVPLIKSVADTSIEAITKRIDAADADGMDTTHVLRARDLLSKYDAVQKGGIHESIFKTSLANAPTAVKALFAA